MASYRQPDGSLGHQPNGAEASPNINAFFFFVNQSLPLQIFFFLNECPRRQKMKEKILGSEAEYHVYALEDFCLAPLPFFFEYCIVCWSSNCQ